MNQRFSIAFYFAFLISCIEPIEFDTTNEPARLVIQGYIGNVAAKDRDMFDPETGYFKVRLNLSSPVSNNRDQPVNGATVLVVDNFGNEKAFTATENGEYLLIDDDFKAETGLSYLLRVVLPNGNIYESIPESLAAALSAGQAKYNVDSKFRIVDFGTSKKTEELKGITVSVDIPQNTQNQPYYYLWELTPSWIFKAPLVPDNHPLKTCWVTNKYYFDQIVLQSDKQGKGGFSTELFFVDVPKNPRLEYDFTVLIKQFSISKEAFDFWEDIKKQNESVGSIFDPPPFSIRGNIVNINDPEDRVLGYFSVVGETSQRWFTNHDELPYKFAGSMLCETPPGLGGMPTPECLSCLEYGSGSSFVSNQEPNWWR